MVQEDRINSAIKRDGNAALRLNVLMTQTLRGLMAGQRGAEAGGVSSLLSAAMTGTRSPSLIQPQLQH